MAGCSIQSYLADGIVTVKVLFQVTVKRIPIPAGFEPRIIVSEIGIPKIGIYVKWKKTKWQNGNICKMEENQVETSLSLSLSQQAHDVEITSRKVKKTPIRRIDVNIKSFQRC